MTIIENNYYNIYTGGSMIRMARIIMITIVLFVLAWVIKEVFRTGDQNKMDDLVQKIRMNGV